MGGVADADMPGSVYVIWLVALVPSILPFPIIYILPVLVTVMYGIPSLYTLPVLVTGFFT